MKTRYLDLDNARFTATMPPEIGSMSYTSGPGRYEVLRCGPSYARCHVVAYTRYSAPIDIVNAWALANELIKAEQEPPSPVAQPPQQLSGVSVDDLVAAFEAFVDGVKKENFFGRGAVSRVREVLEARIAERESQAVTEKGPL